MHGAHEIIEVSNQRLIYSACPKCFKAVDFTTRQCPKCMQNMTTPNFQYKLQIKIAIDKQIVKVVAFNEIAEKLIGCSAAQFYNLTLQYSKLTSVVTSLLSGIYASMKIQMDGRPSGEFQRDPKLRYIQIIGKPYGKHTIIETALNLI